MRLRILAAVFVASLIPAGLVYGYWDENIDVVNQTGVPVFDLKVILEGPETIIDTYDGYPWARFDSVENRPNPPEGKDHVIHWRDLRGNDAPIAADSFVHVGWKTVDGHSTIKSIEWTDLSGNVVATAFSLDTEMEWDSAANQVVVTLTNVSTTSATIVDSAYYRVFSQALPIDSLNATNPLLQPELGGMTALPAIQGTIDPGYSITANIPPVNMDEAVVIRYKATASGVSATGFDQHVPIPQIPTLTEWGLVILTLIMLATMTYVLIKKKRLGQLPT